MPGLIDESKAILDWVTRELGRDTFVNIMEQYHPNYLVGKGEQRSRSGWTDYSEIGNRPETSVVEEVKAHARSVGLWRFEESPRYEFVGSGSAEEAG
jgi:putative pyruvate formate lyase activating enzyme